MVAAPFILKNKVETQKITFLAAAVFEAIRPKSPPSRSLFVVQKLGQNFQPETEIFGNWKASFFAPATFFLFFVSKRSGG